MWSTFFAVLANSAEDHWLQGRRLQDRIQCGPELQNHASVRTCVRASTYINRNKQISKKIKRKKRLFSVKIGHETLLWHTELSTDLLYSPCELSFPGIWLQNASLTSNILEPQTPAFNVSSLTQRAICSVLNPPYVILHSYVFFFHGPIKASKSVENTLRLMLKKKLNANINMSGKKKLYTKKCKVSFRLLFVLVQKRQ